MKLYCGNILTCDSENNVYKYLLEDKGIINYVGIEKPKINNGTEIIDLKDKALIPTFCDTHSHFASYAVLAKAVMLGKSKSNMDMLLLIAKEDSLLKKDKTIIGFGAHSNVEEGKLLSKYDLDKVVPNRYIVVITTDGHTAIINQKTLDKLPKNMANIRGYDANTGIMSKEAFYKLVEFLPKIIKNTDIFSYMQGAIDELITQGFGMVHAASGSGFPADLDVDLLRWIGKGQDNGFQLRIFFQTFNTEKVLKRKLTRLGGCFETALDGSLTSRDAALIEPYCNTSNTGILYHQDEELYEKISKAHNLNLQVEMHAIGDRAFDQATRIFKRVLDENPRPDHRHGIIHCSLVTDEGVQICKDYGIQIITQLAFIDLSGTMFKPMYEAIGERVYTAEQHSRFMRKGIMISASSDAPITIPNPIEWLNKTCNNLNEVNRLTIQEALKVCTYNGYWATFDEKDRGSLEQGKIADMVILSENPYEMDKERLSELKVISTILKGKKYISKKRNLFIPILKGILRNWKC